MEADSGEDACHMGDRLGQTMHSRQGLPLPKRRQPAPASLAQCPLQMLTQGKSRVLTTAVLLPHHAEARRLRVKVQAWLEWQSCKPTGHCRGWRPLVPRHTMGIS